MVKEHTTQMTYSFIQENISSIQINIIHLLLAQTFACIWTRRREEGRNGGRDHTVVKLPEGEGRANPQLSTLLSLQTSEPFATPHPHPPLFLLCTGFSHEDARVCTWIHDGLPASGRAVMVSRETVKSDAPRWSEMQSVMPHFGSQAQTT